MSIAYNPNQLPSEIVALLDRIAPISQAAATVNTAWVSMADFHAIRGVVALGVMQAGSTVDVKWQQATDSSGTGAKDVTGKAVTQLTQAGGSSGKEVQLNLRQDDMDITNGFTYARMVIVVGTAATLISSRIEGTFARYGPASNSNISAVAQVV